MRTLFLAESAPVPMPPEAMVAIMEALRGWRERWRSKMEAFEFFAGTGGGWAVFNTTDEMELSEIMMQFPLGPFMVLHAHPTVDGDAALDRLMATSEQWPAMVGAQRQAAAPQR